MKGLAWWRGLLEDSVTKLASHAKLQALIGSVVASAIMIREAINDRMNSEYFWAYLGILVAGAATSKWIGLQNKLKKKKVVPEPTTEKEKPNDSFSTNLPKE